jgi:signal transduction histidine kinase
MCAISSSAHLSSTQRVESFPAKRKENGLNEACVFLVHDFRALLQSNVASLAVIRKQLPPQNRTPAVSQSLDAATISAKALIRRVNTLLDLGSLDDDASALNLGEVSLAGSVEEVIAELRPLADETNITLINEVSPDLPHLLADEEILARVFQNLLDNALKFTPGGGNVRIRVDHVAGERPYLIVAVMDSGPGIPERDRDRIFERFAQVPGQAGRRPGNGLGLAFCKLAVEAHGGQIWVGDNRPGGGAVFYFTLPVAAIPSAG